MARTKQAARQSTGGKNPFPARLAGIAGVRPCPGSQTPETQTTSAFLPSYKCPGNEQALHKSEIPRPKYEENPFRARKCTYDQRLLEINNPFLEITRAADLAQMPPDNVTNGLMDVAALSKCIDVLLEPVVRTRMQYKSRGGGRLVHASLLHNMNLLTRPSSGNVQVVAGGNPPDKAGLETDEMSDEGNEGEEDVDVCDLEGKVQDARLDLNNNEVTVIVVECDCTSATTKLDQASAYAIRAAISNMRKGRYKPIYVHNWSSEVWRYGVLRCKGVVTVHNGSVVGVRLQEQVQDSSGREALIQSLDYKLKEYTAKLQVDYLWPKRYPDGEYVLGTLHLCEESLDLPLGSIGTGGIRFVNSLIRTFVGDEALSYTQEDIEANVSRRRAEACEHLGDYKTTYSSSYNRLLADNPRATLLRAGHKRQRRSMSV